MRRTMLVAAVCGVAGVMGLAGGCQSDRTDGVDASPKPGPAPQPGTPPREGGVRSGEVMWLGAREHLTRIMQHVAGLTLKGADKAAVQRALDLLNQAAAVYKTDPAAVASLVAQAAEEAIKSLEKATDPNERQHEINCLLDLQTNLQACGADMMCIVRSFLLYLHCINAYQGPTRPVNAG